MAAEAQLAAALWLWFHNGHPAAILALANGAYECYEGLVWHAGRPSPYKDWLSKQTVGFQKRACLAINFIKHGRRKLTRKVPYMPIQADNMMMDAIGSYQFLHGKKTHLMLLFLARWAMENPSPSNALTAPILLRMAKAHDLTNRDRTEFFYEGLKRLAVGD